MAALVLEIILGVVLLLLLVFRGSVRRGSAAVTVIALVLDVVLILFTLGWLNVPGIN